MNYLRQTFHKRWTDGVVFESTDMTFAVFNTGLVMTDYDDPRLCFAQNREPNKQKWFCLGAYIENGEHVGNTGVSGGPALVRGTAIA